jgi:RNA polymerase sigma factor (sigma-70 family)
MTDDPEGFDALIQGLRRGDSEAVREFVRRYEPLIRMKLRTWIRLRHPEMRRLYDSVDICQSIMSSFLLRLATGAYELDTSARLEGLLVVMARNRLNDHVKRHRTLRRSAHQVEDLDPADLDVVGHESPSRAVAIAELLQAVRARLSEEERRLGELRMGGREWASIADEMGGTAHGRRKQWARAVDRVARELGVDDGSLDGM